MKISILHLGLAASVVTSSLFAENWTTVSLHPSGARDSHITAAVGGRQAGTFAVGPDHAAIWDGTRGSLIDLNPPGVGTSRIFAAAGSQQVGSIHENGAQAGTWSGSAASFINLNPLGAAGSTANATNGIQQAGSATFAGPNGTYIEYACIWNGTRASYEDLHPVGAESSRLHATTGAQQAGSATFGGSAHAGIWANTFQSFQDLHPEGALTSVIFATTGAQQVGSVRINSQSNGLRAAVWAGTKESFKDLGPTGSGDSTLYATDGERQVGYATFNNQQHAGIWTGSASSFLDLHAFLPANYTSSTAKGITRDGSGLLQVVGSAHNSATGNREAILWTQKMHRPSVRVLGKKTRVIRVAKLRLNGTASDRDDDLSRVEVKVGNAKYKKARIAGGPTSFVKWRFTARGLQPGATTIRVRAIDAADLKSKSAKLILIRD